MFKSSNKIVIEFTHAHNAKDLASRIVALMGKFRMLRIEDVKISNDYLTLTAERPLFIDDAISLFYMLRSENFSVIKLSYNGEEAIPTKIKIE